MPPSIFSEDCMGELYYNFLSLNKDMGLVHRVCIALNKNRQKNKILLLPNYADYFVKLSETNYLANILL